MEIRTTFWTLLAVFTFAVACGAQGTPAKNAAGPPCPSVSQVLAKPCTPPATDTKKPSAAEQFPFPGEVSTPATTPDAPSADAPAPNAPHPSAASEQPFPTQTPTDAGSSSSSSSDDADAPTAPSPHDEGSEGKFTRRKLPKVRRVQTDDERVDEDLRVANFYANDGNLEGAYLRAKDAVKVQPDYSETHFTLGQIAEKMKKKDEAIAEFKTYLKLDPTGEKMKAAQKALAELQ